MEKRVDPAPDRKLQLSFRKGKGTGRKELQRSQWRFVSVFH